MSLWELKSPKREMLEKVASNPFYYNAFYLNRLLVSTEVKHPVHDFLLMNVHTEAFDTLARNEQVTFAYKRFKDESASDPLIMAGDFNTPLNSANPVSGFFSTTAPLVVPLFVQANPITTLILPDHLKNGLITSFLPNGISWG